MTEFLKTFALIQAFVAIFAVVVAIIIVPTLVFGPWGFVSWLVTFPALLALMITLGEDE